MYPEINQHLEGCTLFEPTTTNDNSQQPKIINLPDVLCTPELFAEIAEHMDLTAIINLASTCKKMHQNYQVALPNLYSLLAKAIGLSYDPRQPFKSQYNEYCKNIHLDATNIVKCNLPIVCGDHSTIIHPEGGFIPACYSTKTILQIEHLWNCIKLYHEWKIGAGIERRMEEQNIIDCGCFPEPRSLGSLDQCTEIKNEINGWYVKNNERFKSLDQLSISSSCLSYLPTEVMLLKNLVNLSLTSNKLKELPNGLEKLINLEIIDLFNNKLSSFPITLCSLPNLKKLFLESNCIKTLPTEIGNLTSLKVLAINKNNLITLPIEICNLRQLNDIWLLHNAFKLEELPVEVLTWAKGRIKDKSLTF